MRVPAVLTNGDMTELAEALRERIEKWVYKSTIPCLDAEHCQDIPDKECKICVLYRGDTEFHADPIQWLLAQKYITKGQALALILDIN